jgi:hypothetical protein
MLGCLNYAALQPRDDVLHSHRHENVKSNFLYSVTCRPTGGDVYEYCMYCSDVDSLSSVYGTDSLLDRVLDIAPVLIRLCEVDTYIDFFRKAAKQDMTCSGSPSNPVWSSLYAELSTAPWGRVGVVDVRLYTFLTFGQLHPPATLSARKEPSVPIGQKAGWALVPGWMKWGR